MTKTVQVQIKNRWTDAVLYTAEVPADMESGLHMRAALEQATQARANLVGANLAGANLVGADLAGAYLAGANLAGANLAGANLVGANLAGANLVGADLAGANLAGANLAGANLADANLADANLAGANLAGAYLADAYLADANLAGANLAGAYLADAYLADAKWRDGIVINKAPIQLYGLLWSVTFLDAHMQIGCELHSLADWQSFDDARIVQMDRQALRFWRDHKEALLSLARAAGRSFEPVEAEAVAA
jgi:uncharacterized protein YjbI with pentapeptide repeats